MMKNMMMLLIGMIGLGVLTMSQAAENSPAAEVGFTPSPARPSGAGSVSVVTCWDRGGAGV